MKNTLSEDLLRQRAVWRKSDMRGEYFRDVTAIIHSTPFRRLKHKTQAFYAPHNDHICTRIEHALHVSTIAISICRALGLDPDLAQAIALAHDLGHAPFGHEGERVLSNLSPSIGGFSHELHSLRVVDVLANNGAGLNLTYAVRDGIVSHCGEKFEQRIRPEVQQKVLQDIQAIGHYPNTYEGCVVRLADKIAYLGRDLEDAMSARFIRLDELDPTIRGALGASNGEIISTLVSDLINESKGKDYVGFSREKHDLILKLYNFNREKIYLNPRMERYRVFCKRILDGIFDYLLELFQQHQWEIDGYKGGIIKLDHQFGEYLRTMRAIYDSENANAVRIVIDYIAGMTDDFAMECITQITLPEPIEFGTF
ncbi:MAG: HD domain-containing protein [bacterium]|nr:HD domain-containing protein [bacterium]